MSHRIRAALAQPAIPQPVHRAVRDTANNAQPQIAPNAALSLQQTIGNYATIQRLRHGALPPTRARVKPGAIQRSFEGTLKFASAVWVKEQLTNLLPRTTKIPGTYKFMDLFKNLDNKYSTLQEISTALGLGTIDDSSVVYPMGNEEVTQQETTPLKLDAKQQTTTNVSVPKEGKAKPTPKKTSLFFGEITTPSSSKDEKEKEKEYKPRKKLINPFLTGEINKGYEKPKNNQLSDEMEKLNSGSTSGKITVLDPLGQMLNKPELDMPVFRDPPDFINIIYNDNKYRVLPGQVFLNDETSMMYAKDKSAISGSEALLTKPPGNLNYEDDVRILGDGHHRFIWGAFWNQDIQAREPSKSVTGPTSWANMAYRKKPGNQEMRPIQELDQFQDKLYQEWMSPEGKFKGKITGTNAEAFIEIFLEKHRYNAETAQKESLLHFIQTGDSINLTPEYLTFVKTLKGKAQSDGALEAADWLFGVKDFPGGQLPHIILSKTVTVGSYNAQCNVIALDPFKNTTADELLDTLLFEVQNARNRKDFLAAKYSEHKAIMTARAEFDTDKKYIEALKATYKVGSFQELLRVLSVPEKLWGGTATYDEKTKLVEMPSRDLVPGRKERGALWWWKTDGWSNTQKMDAWINTPHDEGMETSIQEYAKGKQVINKGML